MSAALAMGLTAILLAVASVVVVVAAANYSHLYRKRKEMMIVVSWVIFAVAIAAAIASFWMGVKR